MAIALLDPMVQNPCPEPPELEADLQDNPGEGFMLLTNDYLYKHEFKLILFSTYQDFQD